MFMDGGKVNLSKDDSTLTRVRSGKAPSPTKIESNFRVSHDSAIGQLPESSQNSP